MARHTEGDALLEAEQPPLLSACWRMLTLTHKPQKPKQRDKLHNVPYYYYFFHASVTKAITNRRGVPQWCSTPWPGVKQRGPRTSTALLEGEIEFWNRRGNFLFKVKPTKVVATRRDKQKGLRRGRDSLILRWNCQVCAIVNWNSARGVRANQRRASLHSRCCVAMLARPAPPELLCWQPRRASLAPQDRLS